MSNRLIPRVGAALYGAEWQGPMARDLGVNDRTMRRWIAGTEDVPTGVWTDLWRMSLERAQELDELEPLLKERSTP